MTCRWQITGIARALWLFGALGWLMGCQSETARPRLPAEAQTLSGRGPSIPAASATVQTQAAKVETQAGARRVPADPFGTGDAGRGGDAPGSESMRVRPRLSVRPGGVLDLTFDDLEFDIERDADFATSMIDESIRNMDGRQVVLRGFMLASSVFQQSGIKQFVLVRDNQQCCFGPGAYLYHNVQVDMIDGQTASFSIRPVAVHGRFSIKPWIGPDGKCYSVYHIAAQRVQ